MSASLAAQATPSKRNQVAGDVALNAAFLLAMLVIWQIASVFAHSRFVPGPIAVAQSFLNLAAHGDYEHVPLWQHCLASLERLLAGFTAGVILGVPLGLLMGLVPWLARGSRATIEAFRFIPPIAWIPMAIILLSGFERYVFLIFLGAFFPVYTSTAAGVARVEMKHRDVAKVHGASRAWIIQHVVVPSVLPDIISGMRIGFGIAWMTIVAAEMAGGESIGIARMMINYAEVLQVSPIIVGMILIAAFGLIGNELLLILERQLFRWRWAVAL